MQTTPTLGQARYCTVGVVMVEGINYCSVELNLKVNISLKSIKDKVGANDLYKEWSYP